MTVPLTIRRPTRRSRRGPSKPGAELNRRRWGSPIGTVGWQGWVAGGPGGHERTPEALIEALAEAKGNRTRLGASAPTPVLKFVEGRVGGCGQMPGDFFLQGLGSARIRHDVLPLRQERPGKRCDLSAGREEPSPRDREDPGVSLRPRRPERRGRGARNRARESRGRPSPLSNRHPGSPRGPSAPRAWQARRSPRRAWLSHRRSSDHGPSPGPDRGRSQAQAARIPRSLPAGLGPAHP